MSRRSLLGVIGGMGPIASAEFLRTIYELNVPSREQDGPACVLYSDPTFPDRSMAIQAGDDAELVSSLTAAAEGLLTLGVDRIVLACMTAHYCFPRLPLELASAIVSLVDIVYDVLAILGKKALILATSGTRAGRIFESHPAWPILRNQIVFPNERDQERIHAAIYELKAGPPEAWPRQAEALKRLAAEYGAESVVAACTEFHLLWRLLESDRPNGFLIDPLLHVARSLSPLLASSAIRSEPAPTASRHTTEVRAIMSRRYGMRG